MAKLNILYRKVSELRPRETNPRTHSKKQIKQIAASIEHFGFTNPVLVDEDDLIVAGHGRLAAAKLLSMDEVPTVCLRDMSEADIRAYVIADNRLAENADWDADLLASEFAYLDHLDIDLTMTGYELPEIDFLMNAASSVAPEDDPADRTPELSNEPPVTQLGDIWQIGRHRLICGDATKTETYLALLGEERAQMVFCDPPYNVPIGGHVSGLGKIKHREFVMASGEMSGEEFTGFLARTFCLLARFSIAGSIHFHCMDWRHLAEVHAAGDMAYDGLKNLCIWAKSNGGMGSLYRSAHELIFVFKSGDAPHINNVELGKHGRYRTNVWSYPGANSFGKGRDEDLSMHPTVKPVEMIKDAILDCSKRKGIVLDAFAGSGSTLVAAEKSGRRGFGIEIDPAYCDVIVRRMLDQFGLEAKLIGSGSTFRETALQRTSKCLEGVQ